MADDKTTKTGQLIRRSTEKWSAIKLCICSEIRENVLIVEKQFGKMSFQNRLNHNDGFQEFTKNYRGGGIKISIWFVVFLALAGLFSSAVESSGNPTDQDELAKIDSGFFVSRNDVYGLQDQAFKEKLLLFLTENGILTKSSKGLTYYYISEDAIAQIEDLEFRGRVSVFVAEPVEKKVHIVKAGDSLWDIATKYRISVEELAHLNNITSDEPIYPGQKLKVAPDAD